MNHMNPEQLEKAVHTALRALPDRKAPAALEARVLAEIERRAAVSWRRKSYAHWPTGVRIAFLLCCGGLASLTVFAAVHLQTGFDPAQLAAALSPWFDVAGRMLGGVRKCADIGNTVMAGIPPSWVYATVSLIAGTYGLLVGIGALAYRTLWLRR